MISIICALAESNRVIGSQGRIPWHITKDLARFKEKTTNHTVIMGRKTFDSLLAYYQKSGRSIPKRNHIIVTRNKKYQVKIANCFIVHSIEEALKLAKKIEKKEIFISGGAKLFKQTINLADKLYLTLVKGDFQGDAFFPGYSAFKKVVYKSPVFKEDKYNYYFIELLR